MKQADFVEVKKLCNVLSQKPLSPFVRAVWIFGSSIKKRGNDIDILVVVDDTLNGYNKNLRMLLVKLNLLKKKTKLNLHFQDPMDITKLWSLMVKGEPWVLTAVKNPLVIYDPLGYTQLIKSLVKGKKIYGKDIKSERLVARSEELLTENREFMLSILEELFLAATEASQIFLVTKNKVVFKPRKILSELNNYLDAGAYFELLDLNEKASKGLLSEFTGEDLDYYSGQVRRFIGVLEKLSKEVKHDL